MSNKSQFTETIAPDDQPGYTFTVQADSSGFLALSMSDGKGASVSMKLNQTDSAAFARLAAAANALRQIAPG